MNLKETIETLKSTGSQALQRIHPGHATLLVQQLFKKIRSDIEAIDEGMVVVPGLGKFRVRKVERSKDGEMRQIKKVFFVPGRDRAATDERNPSIKKRSAPRQTKQ